MCPFEIFKILCFINRYVPIGGSITGRIQGIIGQDAVGCYPDIKDISVARIGVNIINQPQIGVTRWQAIIESGKACHSRYKICRGSQRIFGTESLRRCTVKLYSIGQDIAVRGIHGGKMNMIQHGRVSIAKNLEINPKDRHVGRSRGDKIIKWLLEVNFSYPQRLRSCFLYGDLINTGPVSPACLAFKGHIIGGRRIREDKFLLLPFIKRIKVFMQQHPGIALRDLVVDAEHIPACRSLKCPGDLTEIKTEFNIGPTKQIYFRSDQFGTFIIVALLKEYGIESPFIGRRRIPGYIHLLRWYQPAHVVRTMSAVTISPGFIAGYGFFRPARWFRTRFKAFR